MVGRTYLALDKSVRNYDVDGHLHVKVANISKATVNPYKGEEIPGWRQLGLDPDKVYKLLRHPDELELAAKTFAGKPLLIEHKPLNAGDHPYREVIGAVGNDARYEAPYVKAALTVWPKDAIDLIQKCEQRELSCGYQYTPDMTPGEYEDESYDGIMRDIVGNHVALVSEGRAGSDVIIGDSAQELKRMRKPMTRKAVLVAGAVKGYLLPMLAQDAKLDLAPVFAGVTAKNYASRKDALFGKISSLIEGKLAQDASPKGLKAVLDAMEPDEPMEEEKKNGEDAEEPFSKEGPDFAEGKEKKSAGADPDEDETAPAEDDEPEDNPAEGGGSGSMAQFKDWLKEKLGEDGFAQCEKMLGDMKKARDSDMGSEGGMDEDDEEKDMNTARDRRGARDMRQGKDEEPMTKPAMDRAIRIATDNVREQVLREQRDLREAERFVEPWVGKLKMAYDSADKVLRAALEMRGVKDAKTLHVDALRPILKALPTQAQINRPVFESAVYAADASPFASDDKSYSEMFASAPSVRQ